MNHWFVVLAALAAAIVAGCATPDARPEAEAAAAIGLPAGEAIMLHMEAAPDDAGSAPDSLSLAEAVALTARHSAQLQAACAKVRIAQADAQQARLLPNPVLNVALRFPQSGQTIIDAGLSAELIAILRRQGAIRAADSRLRAASADAVATALDEVASAQEAYIVVQSLEALLRVQNDRRGLLDRLLAHAESRLRIGEGSRLDVLALQTEQTQLEIEIAERETELRDQRLALARLIGQPSSPPEWTVATWIAPAPVLIDEAACIRLALEHRPEVQQRQWELSALGFEQNSAGLAFLDGSEVGVDAERDAHWSVGPSFSLPVPLLDMGQAQRLRASAAAVEARHQLVTARRQAIEETRRAYIGVSAARKTLSRVQDGLLPLEQQRLQQAEAQFRAGQTDISALLIAEQDLRSAQAQLIDLQRKLAIAQLRLERAVGGSGVLLSAAQPATSPTTQRTP